jgi:hypothetical protein
MSITKDELCCLLQTAYLKSDVYDVLRTLPGDVFDPGMMFELNVIFRALKELKGDDSDINVTPDQLEIRVRDLYLNDPNYIEDVEEEKILWQSFDYIVDKGAMPLDDRFVKQYCQQLHTVNAVDALRDKLTLIASREASSDVLPMFASEVEKTVDQGNALGNNYDDEDGEIITPFTQLDKMLIATHAWPTGVDFFDDLTEGGIRIQKLCGLLAPTGGGKTTISTQLMVSWVKQGPNHRGLLVSYEQPIAGDVTERMVTLVSDKSRAIFRDKDYNEWPPELQELVDKRSALFKDRIACLDYSGNNKQGRDGIGNIKRVLNKAGLLKRLDDPTFDPKTEPPVFILIDWLMPMVQRYMNKHTDGMAAVGGDLRAIGSDMMDEIKTFKNTYNVMVLITHQLASAVAESSPTRAANHTESAEWKGFANLLDDCYVVGSRGKNDICIMRSSKARASGRNEVILRLAGKNARFEDLSTEFCVVNGRFVPIDGETDMDQNPTGPQTLTERVLNQVPVNAAPEMAQF